MTRSAMQRLRTVTERSNKSDAATNHCISQLIPSSHQAELSGSMLEGAEVSSQDDHSSLNSHGSTFDQGVLETIAAGLLHVGWAIVDDAVAASVIDSLRADVHKLDDAAFARAGVGRGDDWQRTDDVRRDRVHWLDPESDASQWYFRWIDSLRFGLNRSLLLGLFDYECHFAWYPPGAFYVAHVDAFRGEDNRKVSTILYLNDTWQPGHGGELVLYEPLATEAKFDAGAARTVNKIVHPTAGTLVCFLSEEIPHEVLDAVNDRFSISGWFRVNGNGLRPDPPVFPLSA